MDARVFARFHLDVGIGDAVMKPLETVEGRGWLQFAGITTRPFRTIPQEQQVAEKLHAYTLPRRTPSSRAKDLIDLLLLTCLGRIATGRPIRGVNRKTGGRLTARRGILAPDRRCDSPAFNREAHGRDLSATA